MAGSGSVQAAGCKLLTICNVCSAFPTGRGSTPAGAFRTGSGNVQAGRGRTIFLLALFLLAVSVSRLASVNYQPPLVFARLITLAEAILQLAQSRLALAVSTLHAVNYQYL
jgi:hypothetical protein